MRHQPCPSHSGSWLVYAQHKLEELPISPLRICPFCVILLDNLGQLSTWEPPGFRLWLMYAYYPSREYCYQNSGFPYLLFLYSDHCWIMHPSHTTYSVSFHDGQYICFNLINHPWEQWLEVQSFTSGLVNHTQVNDPNKPVSIYFDVCAAIAKNTGP
jgi:hypothetical protein